METQSIQDFDRAMALGVRRTFKKEFIKAILETLDFYDINIDTDSLKNKLKECDSLPTYLNENSVKEFIAEFNKFVLNVDSENIIRLSYKHACKRTEEETYQAMESIIFNLNTMRSRAGSQVPFSSLNFGLDTSPEGRLAMEKLMLAQEAGLGKGETSIFPITIFRLKKGISYNSDDPNYDLFKLAIRVSAKRLFPKQNWGKIYQMIYA